MCGIAGILRAASDEGDRDAVLAMMHVLEPRGPDGSWLVQQDGLTLGHRRLAILDLSSAGAQPMASASGRFLVSLNGEIYNYREIRDELGLRPADCRSATDTEVLLHAWEKW